MRTIDRIARLQQELEVLSKQPAHCSAVDPCFERACPNGDTYVFRCMYHGDCSYFQDPLTGAEHDRRSRRSP